MGCFVPVFTTVLFVAALAKFADAEFTCTTTGRFADQSDATCKSYYVCSKKANGEFILKSLSCGTTKNFDPDKGSCSSTYECTSALTTTTTAVETTTSSETTTFLSTTVSTTTTEVEEFVCATTGRFNNPNDKLCKTYYLCSIYLGSYISTLYKCPSVAVFDPDLHKCSATYTCPYLTTAATTTTVASTTPLVTESSTYADIPEETDDPPTSDFVCDSRGRFANANDGACKWYYLCNGLRNGSFIQTPYSCPKNSVFDPEMGLCSTLYSCNGVGNVLLDYSASY